MKRKTLLLWILALLAPAIHANSAPVSACVEALEQLTTLQTIAPVYVLTERQQRRYLADADRPAEIARVAAVVAGSCSAIADIRQNEASDAERLHRVRSPECMEDRDRLSMMEKPGARTPKDDLDRTRKRVRTQCPDVDLSKVWLVEWVPPPTPAPPNG